MRRSFKYPRKTSLRLSLECLEARDVPAGNITASLVGHTLRLFGDAVDNNIVIRGDGPGIVEMQGVNTQVNGGNGKLTFSGVQSLWVDAADGNDTVRTKSLKLTDLTILGGQGDDIILVADTVANDVLGMYFSGDESSFAPASVNGNDTILVSGTRVHGNYLFLYVIPDEALDIGGHDVVTLSDTSMLAGDQDFEFIKWVDLEILDYLPAFDPGDAITVDHFNLSSTGVESDLFFEIYGGNGPDTIRLSNIAMEFNSSYGNYLDFTAIGNLNTFGGEGDSVTCENMNISATAPKGTDFAFNQLSTAFYSDSLSLRNVTTQAGTVDADGYCNPNFMTIASQNAELRNVAVTSNDGCAEINLYSLQAIGAPTTGASSFRLANVSVRGSTETLAHPSAIYFYGSDEVDDVTIVNCSAEYLTVDLGGGDDQLTMINNDIISALLMGGDGNDRLTLRNNHGALDYFDFESLV